MVQAEDWPQRSWGLGLMGAVIGLLIYLITEQPSAESALGVALVTFLFVGGVAFAFTVERRRIGTAAVFAAFSAAIVGFVAFWNGGPESVDSWEFVRLGCAIVAVGIAAPLFQAWGDSGSPRPFRPAALAYPRIHDRAWTNAILWFACWAFVGISFALVFLIGQLFSLIGIEAISDLLERGWFIPTLAGGAFGAAAGLLRDREKILVTLQAVLRRVLAVLAPVLGAGLAAFLFSMIFTGLSPLWEATKATTPILLATAAFAVTLANAVIGDSPEDEAKMPVIRMGAMALGAALLPLGVIAAVSIGLRIGQHGLTPDRLWALVFVGIACAYGLAYLYNLARSRRDWFATVRPTNVRLAMGVCVLAFLLSLPIINFGSWSTASQVARLESGKVSPEKFDWAALRFDFGPGGAEAVKRLAKSGKTPEIRREAAEALLAETRWKLSSKQDAIVRAEELKPRLKVLPVQVDLPDALARKLAERFICNQNNMCALIYAAGAREAIYVRQECENCNPYVERLFLEGQSWRVANDDVIANEATQAHAAKVEEKNKAISAGVKAYRFEVRDVKRRQVFVDGHPVGNVFE